MELFSALSNIIEIASGLSSTAESVYRLVGAIAGDVSQLCSQLEAEKAKIDSRLLYDFNSAVKEVRYQGSQTQGMFGNLWKRWQQMSAELSRIVNLKRIDAWQLQDFKTRIEDHLSYGSSCEASYNVFRERLSEAMDIAFGLEDDLYSCANRAAAGAKRTKIGGYAAAGTMGAGAVACGVAAFFTGGLSLIGTAILGAGAAAAAAATKRHAGELQRLAGEFHIRIGSIKESISRMNQLADKVENARLRGLWATQGLDEQLRTLSMETNRRSKVEEMRRNIQYLQARIAYLEDN